MKTHPYVFVGLPKEEQHYINFGIKIHDPDDIISSVCNVLQVSRTDVTSKSRKREHVMARQISMSLIAISNPLKSLKSIGKMFGNRDHSTVIYSKEVFSDLYNRDENFTKAVNLVKQITNN